MVLLNHRLHHHLPCQCSLVIMFLMIQRKVNCTLSIPLKLCVWCEVWCLLVLHVSRQNWNLQWLNTVYGFMVDERGSDSRWCASDNHSTLWVTQCVRVCVLVCMRACRCVCVLCACVCAYSTDLITMYILTLNRRTSILNSHCQVQHRQPKRHGYPPCLSSLGVYL